jgi:hypothetical protein
MRIMEIGIFSDLGEVPMRAGYGIEPVERRRTFGR